MGKSKTGALGQPLRTRLGHSEHARLIELAEHRGTSVSQLMREAVKEFVRAKSNGKPKK